MNKYKTTLYMCITALSTLLITLILQLCLKEINKEYGHLSVSAVDAYSLTPLEGASVLLPEFDMLEICDNDGNAVFSNVPCLRNEQLDRLLPVDFGQTTILCYCEGYQPYAMFYAEIKSGRMREGLTLYMFPENENSGCMIESPPEKWVEELLRIYDTKKR